TRLRAGSHKGIARALVPAGEAGLSLRQRIPHIPDTAARPEVIAAGRTSTGDLCYPFLGHPAQMDRGAEPRFLAQAPLLPRSEPWRGSLEQSNVPVARAISLALEEGM